MTMTDLKAQAFQSPQRPIQLSQRSCDDSVMHADTHDPPCAEHDRHDGHFAAADKSPSSHAPYAEPLHNTHGQMPFKSAPPPDCPDSECAGNDCAHHLTHLEKRVGHLTLDPTGSLRYLGDSSGWYIIDHNLVSLETTPRLKKGPDGAFRWPPITTIPPREGEAADALGITSASTANATSTTTDAAAVAVSASARPGQIPGLAAGRNSSHSPSIATSEQPSDSNNTAENNATDSSQSTKPAACAPCVVTVPRNIPPCGKPPMPDLDEHISLLSLYFRYVHPVFPILCKSYFIPRVLDKERPPTPALMSAVYAAASTYKTREAKNKDELARVRIQMALHFQRAKLYLDEQYTHNSIATILTLLLMSVYEQGTMSTRSWLYSGMATRKAYDLGLHRDMGVAKHSDLNFVSKKEVQIRLRAWWGCYIMDIMVSATLGRPTTIRDFTFDAPFPENYGSDDDELLVHSFLDMDASDTSLGRYADESLAQQAQYPWQRKQPESSKGGVKHPCNPPAKPHAAVAVAERMRDYVALTVGDTDSDASDNELEENLGERQPLKEKPFGVYYLNLLHIFGHVLTEMYTCKPNRNYVKKYCFYDLHSRTERLIALDHELRQWLESLPPELQYTVDDILAARPARCVYIALIHLVYHTAMILLHRPFISRLGDPHQPAQQHCSPSSANSDKQEYASASTPTSENLSGTEGTTDKSHTARPSVLSPLPSHSICTVSAQMISLIGQAIIQDSRIFIMPFLTFMMFTAGTMHLNNVIVAADSWIARRFLKRTLNVMSRLGAHWQVSYKCYTMLNTLVRANRIGLDQVIEDDEAGIRVIKERYREIAQLSQLVYEERFLYREWPSSDRSGHVQSSEPPLRSKAHQDANNEQSGSRHTSDLSSNPNPPSNLNTISRQGSHTTGYKDSVVSADKSSYANSQVPFGQSHVADPLQGENVQQPVLDSFDRMDVSDSSELPRASVCSTVPKNKPFMWPEQMQKMENTGILLSKEEDMNGISTLDSNAGGGGGGGGSRSGGNRNVHNAHLHQNVSSTASTAAYRPENLHGQRLPMYMRIPQLRRFVDANGQTIVPASPYTSVTLSNDLATSSSLGQGGSISSANAPVSSMQYSGEQGQHALSAASLSLGQFVPSLEFFANAEFPLGIGGPNGQASLVIPQAMAAHNNGANLFSALGSSSQQQQGFIANPPTMPSKSTTAASSVSASAPSIEYSNPPFMFYSGGTRDTAGGGFSDTSLLATLASENSIFVANSSSSRHGNDIEAEAANADSRPTPASLGFSGMLIDDDVIRNLPFSGPVSCDLGLGGMESLSSIILRGSNAEPGVANSLSMALDQNTELPPAGEATEATATLPAGNATSKEDGASAETPWKNYVNQVIRIFDNNGALNEGNNRQ
ncbi:fungal-specific transcription factor domain-containing protein [Coemansia spiralis]|nr:fungal-specific transcription factor domain-containing protein [Coemansia spiralis]